MATDAQNSPFIRNLASSDKKVRDQAFNSLKTYLGAQSVISELDLLKLWKGLFYCLWMQDKPILQQHLSHDLASLVSTLRRPVVLPFLHAFFVTIAREWKQIEALRLDKYLYLIRQYIHASFTFLSRNSWKKSLIEQWNDLVEEGPLEPQDMKIPNGMRYHVLDIWVDEMEKVDGKLWELDGVKDTVELLILPIEKLAKEGKLKALRNAAKECLADERLRSWRGQEKGVVEGVHEDEEDEEAEWGGIADD